MTDTLTDQTSNTDNMQGKTNKNILKYKEISDMNYIQTRQYNTQ